MRRLSLLPILALSLLAACGDIAGEPEVVRIPGDEEFLNLREGPGLGFDVILGLPDGTVVNRRDCVTELGQLWCRVSLPGAPRLSGYVSADYLSTP